MISMGGPCFCQELMTVCSKRQTKVKFILDHCNHQNTKLVTIVIVEKYISSSTVHKLVQVALKLMWCKMVVQKHFFL